MPDNPMQWVMFAFFAGGALGGWIIIGMCAAEVIGAVRKIKKVAVK